VQFNAQVVALHTPYPGISHTRAAESLDLPRVVWVHGYEAMMTALHGYHRGLARLRSLLHDTRKLWRLRHSLASAAATVYVSDWLRRTAERNTRFRHPNTEVIPNPVDVDRFSPAGASSTAEVSSGLALNPLRRVHGLDLAVQAYAGLEGTELTIIGLGPEGERIRESIRRVRAPVRLEERAVPHREIPDLLRRFDYFVAPARSATQGVAMCEAMACGLPVVATRVGGIPEYLREGRDGFLVPPQKPEDLRRAVKALTRDPERARSMGREAREHVVQKCSLPKTVGAELRLLAQAAGFASLRVSQAD
jgi:glycosyltransferase involved in cell wall biosynthesis